MARPLRFIPAGSLIEVTIRTVHGRLLLRPSGVANDLIVGLIGRAQRRHEIRIHALAVLSNHAHVLVSADSPQQLAALSGATSAAMSPGSSAGCTSVAPMVHAATKAVRVMLRTAYLQFAAAFREAAIRLRRGDRLVSSPEGAFPPPLPCAAPTG